MAGGHRKAIVQGKVPCPRCKVFQPHDAMGHTADWPALFCKAGSRSKDETIEIKCVHGIGSNIRSGLGDASNCRFPSNQNLHLPPKEATGQSPCFFCASFLSDHSREECTHIPPGMQSCTCTEKTHIQFFVIMDSNCRVAACSVHAIRNRSHDHGTGRGEGHAVKHVRRFFFAEVYAASN